MNNPHSEPSDKTDDDGFWDQYLTTEPDNDPDLLPLAPWVIDWQEFWLQDHKAEDWLCEPFLPRGRAIALYAGAKTGKSLLVLEMCAAIATGRPIFQPRRPLQII